MSNEIPLLATGGVIPPNGFDMFSAENYREEKSENIVLNSDELYKMAGMLEVSEYIKLVLLMFNDVKKYHPITYNDIKNGNL